MDVFLSAQNQVIIQALVVSLWISVVYKISDWTNYISKLAHIYRESDHQPTGENVDATQERKTGVLYIYISTSHHWFHSNHLHSIWIPAFKIRDVATSHAQWGVSKPNFSRKSGLKVRPWRCWNSVLRKTQESHAATHWHIRNTGVEASPRRCWTSSLRKSR